MGSNSSMPVASDPASNVAQAVGLVVADEKVYVEEIATAKAGLILDMKSISPALAGLVRDFIPPTEYLRSAGRNTSPHEGFSIEMTARQTSVLRSAVQKLDAEAQCRLVSVLEAADARLALLSEPIIRREPGVGIGLGFCRTFVMRTLEQARGCKAVQSRLDPRSNAQQQIDLQKKAAEAIGERAQPPPGVKGLPPPKYY